MIAMTLLIAGLWFAVLAFALVVLSLASRADDREEQLAGAGAAELASARRSRAAASPHGSLAPKSSVAA